MKTLDTHETFNTNALLDSGATTMFIDREFAKSHKLAMQKLARAVPVHNVDRTMNKGGSITDEVNLILSYKGHKEHATFAVCNLGKVPVIIGHTWLKHHNPEVDWEMGLVGMT